MPFDTPLTSESSAFAAPRCGVPRVITLPRDLVAAEHVGEVADDEAAHRVGDEHDLGVGVAGLGAEALEHRLDELP